MDLTIPLGILAVAFGFAIATDINTIQFEPIHTPDTLMWNGYTPAVVTSIFADDLRDIDKKASTARGSVYSEPGTDEKAIESLTDYFELRKPIKIIQYALGLVPYTMSGEITHEDEGYRLTVRIITSDKRILIVSRTDTNSDPRNLIRATAVDAMRAIDPYLIAVYYFRQEAAGGKYTKTREEIQHCLTVVPRERLHWPYALWGSLHHNLGEYDKAVEKFAMSHQINPAFPRALLRWGETYAIQGRHDLAIEKYKQTLERDAYYVEAYNSWAASLVALGRTEEAIATLETSLRLNPKFAKTYVQYAELLDGLGKKEEALAMLRRGQEKDPKTDSYVRPLRRLLDRLDPGFGQLATTGG